MGVQINGSEGNVVATKGTYSGNVTIGGTLTYEDVTNIDSVGLVTARTGIEIGARPGVAASISVDGNMIVSGISTFGGDVQVPDKIIHSGDTNTAIRFPAADTVSVETAGSERLRIASDGKVGINQSSPTISQFEVKSAQLGGTAGNTQEVVRLYSPDVTNTTSYRFTNYRVSNGTSHSSSELRFRRHVDVTDMGYFGLGDSYVSIGYGTAEKLRINSNGEFIMSDSSTKTFIDLETTGNNTRAIMSLKGKTSGGGDVHLIMGGYGDTNRGEVFTYTNHDLGFATNNAAAQFKCKTNGNFEIVNGDLVVASGHGIDFSATANSAGTSTSELLDDYEEGSCVPTQINGSFTPSSADGKYTKVGRLVTWMMHINFDSTASNNHLKIGNLPFTAGSGRSGTAIVRYSNDDEAFKIAWHVDALNATAVAYYLDGGALVPSNAVSQKRFDLTFVYEAT